MVSGCSSWTRCPAPPTITSSDFGSAAAISSECSTGVSRSWSPHAISVGTLASAGRPALSSCTSSACRNSTSVAIGVSCIIFSENATTLGLIFSSPKDAARRIGAITDLAAPRVRCTVLGA